MKTLEDFVGNTPLVQLKRLPGETSNVVLAKLEGNNPGQATHRYQTGHGMQIYNTLNGDPALNSYWLLTIIDEGATRGGCAPSGSFKEPSDACYEWNGLGECTTLNQNGWDGRPRWTTK